MRREGVAGPSKRSLRRPPAVRHLSGLGVVRERVRGPRGAPGDSLPWDARWDAEKWGPGSGERSINDPGRAPASCLRRPGRAARPARIPAREPRRAPSAGPRTPSRGRPGCDPTTVPAPPRPAIGSRAEAWARDWPAPAPPPLPPARPRATAGGPTPSPDGGATAPRRWALLLPAQRGGWRAADARRDGLREG